MNSNHEVKSSNHQKKSKLWSSNTHSTLKQLSTRSFREKLVAKMKYIPNALKFGSPSRSGLLILNMIFGNCGSWPQNCDVFQGSKFGTSCKSNMLLMNMWNWWSGPKNYRFWQILSKHWHFPRILWNLSLTANGTC